jgi:hypothetical protein
MLYHLKWCLLELFSPSQLGGIPALLLRVQGLAIQDAQLDFIEISKAVTDFFERQLGYDGLHWAKEYRDTCTVGFPPLFEMDILEHPGLNWGFSQIAGTLSRWVKGRTLMSILPFEERILRLAEMEAEARHYESNVMVSLSTFRVIFETIQQLRVVSVHCILLLKCSLKCPQGHTGSAFENLPCGNRPRCLNSWSSYFSALRPASSTPICSVERIHPACAW